MFSKQLRHINRYRDIATILANQGFGFLIEETELIEKIPYHEQLRGKFSSTPAKDLGERIRNTLQELGPTYIKLGQIASTRADLLPNYIIVQLEKLQDNVSPFDFSEVEKLIKEELGVQLNEIFSVFDHKPLATASIGQVHLAQLKTGQQVAVKLQRPNIATTIETDLEILFDIANIVQKRFQWAREYQLLDIIDEFSKSLLKELDYNIEARNTDKMKSLLENQSEFYVPKIHWEFSTRKILTMEFLHGIKINQSAILEEKGYSCHLIAERFAKGIFQQIFVNGYFHGDPHPGNILVLPENTIAFLDFGMIGYLNAELKNGLASILIGLKRNDTDELLRAVLRIGIIPSDIDTNQLKNDIEFFRDTYYGVPISKISIGEAINDFFGIAQKHSILIPSNLVLVGKALLTVESTVRQLDAELSLIDIIEPFGRKLFLERFHPHTLSDSLWHIISNFNDLLKDFPQDVRKLRTLINHEHLQIKMSLSDNDALLKHLAQLSNRISVSIILLAFSILMGSIIISFSIMGKPSMLWNLPIIEAGIFIATLMFVWVIYAIFRSGKL